MIDVKTLRIGAHIKVDGKIQKICSIDNDGIGVNIPITYKIVCGSSIISKESIYEQSYSAEEIDPIPLTSELLTEIGFVCRPRELAKDRVKNFFIDAESARIMEETRLCFPQIELSYYSEIGEPELWRVRILCDNKSPLSNADLATEAEITVRYLHELESFVYLTIGKELME